MINEQFSVVAQSIERSEGWSGFCLRELSSENNTIITGSFLNENRIYMKSAYLRIRIKESRNDSLDDGNVFGNEQIGPGYRVANEEARARLLNEQQFLKEILNKISPSASSQ